MHPTMEILFRQLGDPGIFGLLAVFLTPMIFGGITTYYCMKTQEKITAQVWAEWREDETYLKQKPTSSINYNQ